MQSTHDVSLMTSLGLKSNITKASCDKTFYYHRVFLSLIPYLMLTFEVEFAPETPNALEREDLKSSKDGHSQNAKHNNYFCQGS
jgi:hypothetical protein